MPQYAEAHSIMGIILSENSDLEAAINSYKQAIKIKPDYAGAYRKSGISLNDKGKLDAPTGSYEQATKLKPDPEVAQAMKLRQQARICDWTTVEQDRAVISELGASTHHVSPLSLEDAPERHRLWLELYVKNA